MRRFLQLLHAHELQHLVDARIDLGLGLAQHFEAEADILANRHMREERVVLEDGVDRALEGRQRRDVLAIEADLAFGREVEAGDQAEQRGLAAARRPEQREELVLADGAPKHCRAP